MSGVMERFLIGFGFRSRYPSYQVGDEIVAIMTDYRRADETGIVRIGDTVLEVPGAEPGQVEQRVQLRVTDFDASEHRGRAEVISRVESDATV